jgi:phospholipase D1/2
MADQDNQDEPATASPGSKLHGSSPRLNKELPPIPQGRALADVGPQLGSSDFFDFAAKQSSSPAAALDYVNNGEPHTEVSPTLENGSASQERVRPHIQPVASYGARNSDPAIPNGRSQEGMLDSPSSPPGRRSVQFARNEQSSEFAPPGAPGRDMHGRNGSWDASDALSKLRGSAFVRGIKTLAAQSGSQLSRATGGASGSGDQQANGSATPGTAPGTASSSPVMSRRRDLASSGTNGTAHDEGSDVDADAEETGDEMPADRAPRQKKKKRRIPRPKAPRLTPSNSRFANVQGDADSPLARHGRLGFMRRSQTVNDGSELRAGLSEGEGRDQLMRRDARRGSSYTGADAHEAEDVVGSPTRSRLGHMRRISVFGTGASGISDGEGLASRRPMFGDASRATTYGVQKWHQVKNTFKLLRQKREDRFDYFKSAELMAELRAGAPAVLMLASMIQRDEHGNHRIPVLLEQLKLHIRDSTPVNQDDAERHWLFTIDLEYGNGPSRMKWTIKRTIREILNLHWKYKIARANAKEVHIGPRLKQPKFPISAFPYLRGARGLDENEEEDALGARADDTAGEGTAGEGTAGENTAPEGATDGENVRIKPAKRKSRLDVLTGRRTGSNLTGGAMSGVDANGSQIDITAARRKYSMRQQQLLEKYIQEMVRWLMFRADSNRLCRFLELSALGVRLAAEGGYHGKECYLHIQSAKGIDFRRVLTPAKVLARHSRKWFLVRQSYIVCVESPENMNIYDVYLVDAKFDLISKKGVNLQITPPQPVDEDGNIDLDEDPKTAKHHTLTLATSERKVKLFSRNQHLIQQFEASIKEMLRRTPWHLQNRFGSFSPVRAGVHAQWLVDGRDYMWNVSRAINMARDVIYIHDWWLTPELYMRRPAAISQKWRLDRLLQRKAREGVKVFVIVYRNVEAAIPIDSEYTKFSLLNLHPNIFVQRSPNQFKKNQFFFAHHEKICIVDHDVAFVGGIDLCFGRWDCPQHPVADDKPTGFEQTDSPKDAEHCQLFPGKDYSNPRVQDFYSLREPYEEMYDRSRVPRMPWHDISMQVVGQPARDLTRHFVQRWNYVRRGRKPTRPTPFLLPPPDSNVEDLEALGLTGTCEVQILRSATAWSLGIDYTEASIQSAYVKMIEDSDHFVYMENQFFITSTETLNTKIQNRIGDALVERIARAYENDEDWRAVIIIPLMPGFQNEVNEQDGTSVRLILQCQFRSICRGEHSIFGRLRAMGIEPEDYIQFFSLRQWGKLNNRVLTTEQLYIHAKCIIVDDRVALIGSANINERSMLGTRDSETAAIVRDTDMLWSTMAGKPYRVGRFAHTLRLRLMREHLGLDVDEILEEERMGDVAMGRGGFEEEMAHIYGKGDDDDGAEQEIATAQEDDPAPAANLELEVEDGPAGKQPMKDEPQPANRSPFKIKRKEIGQRPKPQAPDANAHVESTPDSDQEGGKRKEIERRIDDVKSQIKNKLSREDNESSESSKSRSELAAETSSHQGEVAGYGPDHWKSAEKKGLDQGRDSVVINGREFLVHDTAAEGRGTIDHPLTGEGLQVASNLSLQSGNSAAGEGPSNELLPPMPALGRRTTTQLGLPRANQLPTLPVADDTDIGGPPALVDPNTGKPIVSSSAQASTFNPNPLTADLRLAHIHKDCMRDPLNAAFYDEVWSRVAENNTKIFRRVFRVMPDNEVTNWHEYQEYKTYNARFMESMQGRVTGEDSGPGGQKLPGSRGKEGSVKDKEKTPADTAAAGGAGIGAPGPTGIVTKTFGQKVGTMLGRSGNAKVPGTEPPSEELHEKGQQGVKTEKVGNEMPADAEKVALAEDKGGVQPFPGLEAASTKEKAEATLDRRTTFTDNHDPNPPGSASSATANATSQPLQPATTAGTGTTKRRRRATTRGTRRGQVPEEILTPIEAEEVLSMTQGALVQFPYDWLIVEETNGNWMFQVDQVAPLQI